MTEAPLDSVHSESIPGPREDADASVKRLMIVAEAKLLVKKLDEYLEILDEWEEDNAEQ